MKHRIAVLILSSAAASGCVLGYGPCQVQQPFKSDLTGTLHYRKFPAPDGVDNVPVLSLDKTAYIYSPATSRLCQSADDVQLLPLTDLPDSVHENTRLEVHGSLVLASDPHEHTRFVMNVRTFRVLKK